MKSIVLFAAMFLASVQSFASVDESIVVLRTIRQKMEYDGSAYTALMLANATSAMPIEVLRTTAPLGTPGFKFTILGSVKSLNKTSLNLNIEKSYIAYDASQQLMVSAHQINSDLVLFLVDKRDYKSFIGGVNRGLSAVVCKLSNETQQKCALVPSSSVLGGGAYEGLISGPYLVAPKRVVPKMPLKSPSLFSPDLIDDLLGRE